MLTEWHTCSLYFVCFVAFLRIYMYVCVFFATTSLVNKDLCNIGILHYGVKHYDTVIAIVVMI